VDSTFFSPSRPLRSAFGFTALIAAVAPLFSSCASAPSAESAALSAAAPCVTAADCLVSTDPCSSVACRAGACVSEPAPPGPIAILQDAPGDCRRAECDGAGKIVLRPHTTDIPADDGNLCTGATCLDGQPAHRPVAPGTSCGKGGACNARGACGECAPNAKRCGDGASQTCSDEGTWVTVAECTLCRNNACVDVADLALGDGHACLRLGDGTVTCWGENTREQAGRSAPGSAFSDVLGPRSETKDQGPALIKGIIGARQLAVGGEHACAILGDGSLKCWGYNDYGQLGDGTNQRRLDAVPVKLPGKITGIAAGGHHTCAILESGAVRCWGRNEDGQLGDGTVTRAPPVDGLGGILGVASTAGPETVPGLAGTTALRSNGDQSCGLVEEGKVRCWGRPFRFDEYYLNAMQNAAREGRSRPVTPRGLRNATALALGDAHSCALLADKTVACWGHNGSGQIGNASVKDEARAPVPVTGLADVVEIAAGSQHTCARLGDGTVRCWGSNSSGQLGDGSDDEKTAPVSPQGLSGVVQLIASGERTCARLAGASASFVCWGSPHFGLFGKEAHDPALKPTRLSIMP